MTATQVRIEAGTLIYESCYPARLWQVVGIGQEPGSWRCEDISPARTNEQRRIYKDVPGDALEPMTQWNAKRAVEMLDERMKWLLDAMHSKRWSMIGATLRETRNHAWDSVNESTDDKLAGARGVVDALEADLAQMRRDIAAAEAEHERLLASIGSGAIYDSYKHRHAADN
jgi:hypothetical protein